MKKVFTDNREIAHLWMTEAQDEARSAGRGNFYFTGPTIYSYGSHFPIATIRRNAQGVKAVLFTTDSYSVTTSGHLADVRRALDSSPVFHIPRPDRGNMRELFESYGKRIERAIESIKPRMRQDTKTRIFGEVCDIVDEANRFADWAGLADRISTPESLETVAGNFQAARAESERLAKIAHDKAEAKRKRDAGIYRRAHHKYLENWRNTGQNRLGAEKRYCNDCDYMGPCLTCPQCIKVTEYQGRGGEWLNLSAWPGDLLRFDDESQEIETSRGARVPVAHARRAYQFVAGLKRAGKEWKRNGHTFHIGPYALDSVDKKGNIKAGCQSIRWSEILALAVRMDWVNAPVVNVEAEVTA